MEEKQVIHLPSLIVVVCVSRCVRHVVSLPVVELQMLNSGLWKTPVSCSGHTHSETHRSLCGLTGGTSRCLSSRVAVIIALRAHTHTHRRRLELLNLLSSLPVSRKHAQTRRAASHQEILEGPLRREASVLYGGSASSSAGSV